MAMTDGIMPVMDVSPSNDGGFGGGGGMWIFFLFILLLFKDGGFGGSSAAQAQGATLADLNNISNQINSVNNGLCDGFYAQNTTMLQGFNGVDKSIAQLGYNMQNCCCETNRNIDAVRFENAQNTCAITNAIHQDGEATRALINANTMQELRDRLAAAELGLSQAAQTANIVAQVRPFPQPAYITCSPYSSPSTCSLC